MNAHPDRASLHGLESEVFKLVSDGATPTQWKEWLRVPLEHAAARGNVDLFNALVKAGADGSAGWKGCHGRTLLDAAAVGGSVDVMSTLLHGGCQPDVNVVSASSKRSALYTAIKSGHEEAARLLVVAGADVNFEDPGEMSSVLSRAIVGGHELLVNDLVIGGADVRDEAGSLTPLHIAAIHGHCKAVSCLLLRGADKDAVDYDGLTPLHRAAERGNLPVVKILLAAGADAGIRTRLGNSLLGCAAKSGKIDVLKAVLGLGLEGVNSLGCGRGACRALHVAAMFDQADTVHALVEAGADIDPKTTHGFTPLSMAAYRSKCNALLALLQCGASATARDGGGVTPLHRACMRQCEGLDAVVDLLLRWGADETATHDASTASDLLDDRSHADFDCHCSEAVVVRTRLLLARAPADRAWRRRCLPVILRSRAKKARTSIICDSGGEFGDEDTGDRREGDRCKLTRRDRTKIIGVVEENEADGGSSLVAFLVGLEPQEIFRTIVCFL